MNHYTEKSQTERHFEPVFFGDASGRIYACVPAKPHYLITVKRGENLVKVEFFEDKSPARKYQKYRQKNHPSETVDFWQKREGWRLRVLWMRMEGGFIGEELTPSETAEKFGLDADMLA